MKYIIKKTYEAREDGGYFKKGYKQVWFLAKGRTGDQDELTSYVASQGYERKCDAVRRLKFEEKYSNWESAQGFWNITNELVEVEA